MRGGPAIATALVCAFFTTANTYRTLAGLEVVLLSGTRIDTAAPDADERLRAAEPELFEGLQRLRDRVRGFHENVRDAHPWQYMWVEE